MRYRNIIFDVGGVLLSYRWLGLIMETIPDEQEARRFARIMFDDPLWLDFDLEIRPFDDVMEDYIKKNPEHEEHIRYMLTHLEGMPLKRPKVWEKVHELKKAGYRLYLLSNYSSRMFEAHTRGLPFHDDMDGRVISYEVHHVKPHKEIYQALLDKYSLDPSECLFFDDRQDNIEGALKLGIDGRVIYSEETLLGYLDRLLAPEGVSCPFHDPALSRKERIDWLLSNMTTEEKISFYSHPERGVARFGVEGFFLGGEAAHGVEGRNDQNGLTYPDTTTAFPEPIGMSAARDPELMYEAGRTVGEEARACFKKHRRVGLSRWSPTVDMERDPRWGRNEEGYGEDPYLTSKTTAAYIKGMQGVGTPAWDKGHVLCGATVKHFLANNKENDRFFANSSLDIRDKYDYYLRPFHSALKDGHALGLMTAYNKINGVPAMTDPAVAELKEKYGLAHSVSDGFALVRLRDFHHEYGTLGECLAASLDAGVDWIHDRNERQERALREALDLGVMDESRFDDAIGRMLNIGMMTGVYEASPYDDENFETDSEEARKICRTLSEESLVLLENKNLLPLKDSDDIALVGPLADEWRSDWYAGVAPFRHTLRDGIREVTGKDAVPVMGLDGYRIVSDGKAWHVRDDGALVLVPEDEGDIFYVEDRGEGAYVIRSCETGKYVQSTFYGLGMDEIGFLKADRDDAFDWFVTVRFHIREAKGGVTISDRFDKPVGLDPDGTLRAWDRDDAPVFELKKMRDGIAEALDAAKDSETVILALGCDPMIPAREDFDRKSLGLPSCQQRLLDAFIETGKKVVTVLISNYPYTMQGVEKKIGALLLSSTGSEYMGDAIASALFGRFSPAGKLSQGWPASEDMLPELSDYAVRGKRTCRYMRDGLIYPFGYGLSYTEFEYTEAVAASGDASGVSADAGAEVVAGFSLKVRNKGAVTSDHVVEIYATLTTDDPMFERYGYGKRLVGFKRLKDMKPGEIRDVSFGIEKDSLTSFDPAAGEYILPGGRYTFLATDAASGTEASASLDIAGEEFAERNLSKRIPVYACDESEGVEFIKGHYGMTAARAAGEDPSITFYRCRMPEERGCLKLLLRSKEHGSVRILFNGEELASWSGSTSGYEKPVSVYKKPSEDLVLPESWEPLWYEVECSLPAGGAGAAASPIFGAALPPGPDCSSEKAEGAEDAGKAVKPGRIDIIPGGDTELLSFFIYNGI